MNSNLTDRITIDNLKKVIGAIDVIVVATEEKKEILTKYTVYVL